MAAPEDTSTFGAVRNRTAMVAAVLSAKTMSCPLPLGRTYSTDQQRNQPLAELGRREDALTAITEAVQIRRELAAARPDAFRPDLAMSLTNQSNRLAELGRREDALTAITEAVQIRRELAEQNPVFREGLARSLTRHSGFDLPSWTTTMPPCLQTGRLCRYTRHCSPPRVSQFDQCGACEFWGVCDVIGVSP